MTSITPISARSSTDLLSLIPYLLGFHVDSGAVVLVCSGSTVEVVLRFDEWMFDAPTLVQAKVAALVGRFEETRVFFAAYTDDPDVGERVLGVLETAVDPGTILDSVRCDGQRWWSRWCPGDCCPPEGTPCDAATPAAASAVLAGSVALSSRRELERLVEGPEEVSPAVVEGLARVGRRMRRWSSARRVARMQRLVADLVPGTVPAEQAVELALLAQDIGARDAAWLEMGLHSARDHVALWSQVVQTVPDEVAVPPLCLMAAAAWLEGNGALMGCCLERASGIDPTYSMLSLLCQIHLEAAPPSLWNQMAADFA